MKEDGQFANLDFLAQQALWKGSGDYSRQAICRVMEHLGNPQDSVRTCLIGGTNGKGSVSAMVASIATASGLKSGLLCSPHLSRVNERFLIDGCCVSDEQLDWLVGEVRNASERLGEELSYFEIAVGASFVGLRENGCDIGVVEVGLGGERDATNIIADPQVSSIVSVSLDHQNILGQSVPDIARDKAGICRSGRQFVLGTLTAGALEQVHQVADRVGACPLSAGKDFGIERAGSGGKFLFSSDQLSVEIDPVLKGEHQIGNTAVALQIARSLQIDERYWQSGLSRLNMPARLERQIYRETTEVIIDAAHNPAGMKALRAYLESQGLSGVTIGIGLLDGANWKEMIDIIKPVVSKWRFVTPQTPRALPESEIRSYASCMDISPVFYGTDFDGFVESEIASGKHEQIVLAGSIYLIGELRSLLFGPVQRIF